MKKITAMIIAFAMLLTAVLSFSSCAKEIPVIGISQFGEHASLDNCREGFLAGLAEAGLTEGKDYTVDYQNAAFDGSIATQIATGFSAKNVALMVGIATPSATACYAAAEDKDIPVVFVAVSDPAQAKLDSGNVTGVSDALPVEAQLDLIRKMQPDAKKIGIIYTTSEQNSVSTVAQYQEAAPKYGFELEVVGITQQSDVTQAVDTIIARGVDCFTNLTDNTVVGVLTAILEKTDNANIPVYGSEVEQVKLGCIAAAGIDYVQLGKQAGAMAAKILKGEAKASDIKFETITEYGIYINSNTAVKLGIAIPTEIAQKAVECAN